MRVEKAFAVKIVARLADEMDLIEDDLRRMSEVPEVQGRRDDNVNAATMIVSIDCQASTTGGASGRATGSVADCVEFGPEPALDRRWPVRRLSPSASRSWSASRRADSRRLQPSERRR